MHQAVDMNVVQSYKNAEARHAGNFTAEHFADFVPHIIGFQPIFNVARSIVGAALTERSMHTQFLPRFAGIVFFTGQYSFYCPMYGQIRVTSDRRSEVCISVIGQTEMTVAVRLVNCLLHRTQHHNLQQFGIRPPFELLGQNRIIFRRRIVPSAQTQSCQRKLFAQCGQFFRSRTQMVAE